MPHTLTLEYIQKRRLYIKNLIETGEKIKYEEVAEIFECSCSAIKNDEHIILTGSGYKTRLQGIILGQNARAKRFGLTGTVSYEDWELICQQHNYRCASCGEKLPLTMDHIKPLTKGGLHSKENIQPLCGPCNVRKGNR